MSAQEALAAASLPGAVVSTAVPHALYYWLIAAQGASRSVLITYMTPVFALGLGALFLGEPTTAPKLAGLGLIVTGVALGAGVGRGARRVRFGPELAAIPTQAQL